MSGFAGHDDAVQDHHGIWWYQDPEKGSWSFWNGQIWQTIPGASPRIVRPEKTPVKKSRRSWPALLTIFSGSFLALIVVGGITLVAYNFIPEYHINPGEGDIIQILMLGGGGMLATVVGLLMFNRGFRTILALSAIREEGEGLRNAQRGCSAILNGSGQLFFGILFTVVGLGLMSVALYQEILPWLGY
jgi:hypothetical protein